MTLPLDHVGTGYHCRTRRGSLRDDGRQQPGRRACDAPASEVLPQEPRNPSQRRPAAPQHPRLRLKHVVHPLLGRVRESGSTATTSTPDCPYDHRIVIEREIDVEADTLHEESAHAGSLEVARAHAWQRRDQVDRAV